MQFWEEMVMERQQGEALGLKKGETVKIISQVRKKQLKGMDAEAIADALEESPEFVKRILNVLQSNPEAADEEVFEKVK